MFLYEQADGVHGWYQLYCLMASCMERSEEESVGTDAAGNIWVMTVTVACRNY